MSLFAATLLMLAGAPAPRTIDNWMVYDGADVDRESILFVERSALSQRPDGWINFSFQEVRNGSRLKSVKSMRMTAWANCKTREYINDFWMEYGSDGAMLQQGKLNEQQRRVPATDSTEGRVLAFVCGDSRGVTQLPQGTNIVAYADSLYAQGHPQVARAPAAAPATPTNVPVTRASIRGTPDYWKVTVSDDGNVVTFVDRASIASLADGKTGFAADNVAWVNGRITWTKGHSLIDCARHTFRELDLTAYDQKGGPIGPKTPAPEEQIEAKRTLAEVFAFVCEGDMSHAIRMPAKTTLVEFATAYRSVLLQVATARIGNSSRKKSKRN